MTINLTALGALLLLLMGVALTASPIPGGFLVVGPAIRILRRSSVTAAALLSRFRNRRRMLDAVLGRLPGR